jgi:hypothetical protein
VFALPPSTVQPVGLSTNSRGREQRDIELKLAYKKPICTFYVEFVPLGAFE